VAKQSARILVLGSTGHMGQAVVRHWLARGQRVTATTRQTDPDSLRGLAVKVVRVDDELNDLAGLATDHDLIVDAAAPHPLEPCARGGAAWRQAISAAVRRTERVIEAARAHRLRLAFISSFTTLPRPESPIRAIEAAWRRSVYPYFEAKAVMEGQVIEAARRGLQVAVINPAAALGPWEFRSEGSSFVRLVLAGHLPLVMDQTINVIDVRDVAVAIEQALIHECFGRPIPLAGHNTTVAALAARIAALDGHARVVPLGIASSLASATAFWAEATFAALGRPTPDLWRAVPLIADGFSMSASLEQSAIGLTIRPLEDTLRDAVAFHRGREVG
jgi:dihydroflavonol-4-reductase